MSYNNSYSLSWQTAGSQEHHVTFNPTTKDATHKTNSVCIEGRSYALEGASSDQSLVLDALRQRSFASPEEFQKALAELPFLTDHKATIKPTSATTVLFHNVLGSSQSSKTEPLNKLTAGNAQDIQKQDEQAEKMFLATYKALHMGGKATPESKLIQSTLLPVKMMYQEINQLLSKNFDMNRTPIASTSLISEAARRNRIIRIELQDTDKSIIFKESRALAASGQTLSTQEIKHSYDRFARDWAGLEFVSGLDKENPLCPQCYGGSKENRFVLMEDLGEQKTLADHLIQGDASAAGDSLNRYMNTLGRFHAAGHERISTYLEILNVINPEAPQISSEINLIIIQEIFQNTVEALTLLGLTQPKGLMEEIESTVVAMYDQEGPFATVLHGDPCPDNVFDYSDKLLLIDFEWASIGSAFLDAAYPRMSMPSGWCAGTFPETVLDEVESVYRNELKKTMPAANDDAVYFKAYTQACALPLFKGDMRGLQAHFTQDDRWGIATIRERILSHLTAFINVSQKYDTLPALRSAAIDILAVLKEKWPESQPLALYPAFALK